MELFRSLQEFPDRLKGGALSIGNFDGVHSGHAKLIGKLKDFAEKSNGPAIVFTFDPHPVRLLRPNEAPPPLTWTYRKAELLSRIGVDAMIAYPTDQALLELEYAEFFQKIVIDKVAATAMVEGPNFYFGKGRAGDTEKLRQLCEQNTIELDIVQPEESGSQLISSSRIRHLIKEGEIDKARSFLTEPYRIRGMVTHGASRGKQIGFPTANLDAIDTLIPAPGVYAGRAFVSDQSHWAAIHIGPNPTFQEYTAKVEVHILDFESTIYGQVLEVDFVSRLRGIHEFDSLEKLVQQVNLDVAETRKVASEFETSK